MRAFVVLLLVGAVLLDVSAAAQQDKQENKAPAASAANGNIVLPDKEYIIGPTDIVEVYILKMPELSREYRVSADGTIQMPFLGQIKAEKKTSHELAETIAKGLQGDYLVDPQVSV